MAGEASGHGKVNPRALPGFAIAKPRGLFHRSSPMTKPVCCLLLALGLTACEPKKAIVIEEPSQPTGTRKPANRTNSESSGAEELTPRLVNQDSGMRSPDLTNRLPDGRDMKSTAPVGPGGGSGTIATPPTADKRGE